MLPDSISQGAISRKRVRLLAFEGDSKVVWFEGNYSEYEAQKGPSMRCRRSAPPHQVQALNQRVIRFFLRRSFWAYITMKKRFNISDFHGML